MKIISTKEYERLKDIENKYRELAGETITLVCGGRTRRSRLLNLSKEELVYRFIELDNITSKLQKKLKDSDNKDEQGR